MGGRYDRGMLGQHSMRADGPIRIALAAAVAFTLCAGPASGGVYGERGEWTVFDSDDSQYCSADWPGAIGITLYRDRWVFWLDREEMEPLMGGADSYPATFTIDGESWSANVTMSAGMADWEDPPKRFYSALRNGRVFGGQVGDEILAPVRLRDSRWAIDTLEACVDSLR